MSVHSKYGERLAEIKKYIDLYRVKHPHATKREICLQYMREKNLIGLFKQTLPELADERDLERYAIQSEDIPF